MSDKTVTPLAKNLMKARSLIEDAAKWCQGEMEDGQGRMCAYGAVRHVFVERENPDDITSFHCYKALDRAAKEMFPASSLEARGFGGLNPAPWVNDNKGHEATLRMFDHAIAKALGGSK